jgi:hypothetical protein
MIGALVALADRRKDLQNFGAGRESQQMLALVVGKNPKSKSQDYSHA